jgi:hypothetical protein
MKTQNNRRRIMMSVINRFIIMLLCVLICAPLTLAQTTQDKSQESSATKPIAQDVLIIIQQEQVRFTAQKAIQNLQLQIFDQTGELIYNSGVITEPELTWSLKQGNGETVKSGLYAYTLSIQEIGAETARVRRGHFIVDRARERDGQTDRLWITSHNEGGVGTELTVARNEGMTIAGTSAKSVKAGDKAQSKGRGEQWEPKTRSDQSGSETKETGMALAAVTGKTIIQGSEDPLLEINHTGASGHPAIWFKQDGAPKAFIWWDQFYNSLRLGTIGVNPILTMMNNGNVGIGTTTPNSRLEIAAQDGLQISGYQPFLTLSDGNAGWARVRMQNVNGGINFQTHDLTAIGGTAMYIQNGTHNVGLGTHLPQAKLDVIGTTRTSALQITGGADFAENFDVNVTTMSNEAATPKVEVGMVVSLDPASPGKLALSTRAYDRRVAGIISGAGGVKPGMVMSQEGTPADGKHPVALSGRVYCWVDASQGAIEVGDLLTTSSTPGHAMKAADAIKAQGAIIGKAMTSLKEGKGLVLVLVTLQ